ncbi:MAG: hypothetical protein A2Y10_11110 [Planctomycetes bacterium GWF2_41_51]|nr:MAG: hypothetical protein A2Y10_11110 [Planctomycetes bacterium GWF2_41_51]HBG28402.1 mechanosensitive ion channel protein MscS [Phycisphaerales bacterium]
MAILPVTVLFATIIVGLIVRGIISVRLSKWSHTSKIGRLTKEIVRGPVIIWFLMLGIYLALEVSVLPGNIVNIVGKILLALGLLSITLMTVNLTTIMISKHSGQIEGVLPITSLTQNIARVIILMVGILIILNTLGISIAPILATLGVGGLAVALAMQDTLGNIFAGFYVVMSRQIRVGDYVKLDSGEEGYVVDITWRATKIRALANNLILIPNEKLTKAIATNYYLPEKEMSVLMQVGVHYNSDLKHVEKVTIEVAKETLKEVKGGVPEFEPFIRYHTFSDFSINFSVILRAKEFTDQYLIKHEFIKNLHERYAKEGINIPYPIRAINFSQEKSMADPGEKF